MLVCFVSFHDGLMMFCNNNNKKTKTRKTKILCIMSQRYVFNAYMQVGLEIQVLGVGSVVMLNPLSAGGVEHKHHELMSWK